MKFLLSVFSSMCFYLGQSYILCPAWILDAFISHRKLMRRITNQTINSKSKSFTDKKFYGYFYLVSYVCHFGDAPNFQYESLILAQDERWRRV